MPTDINDRDDLNLLVRQFYKKAMSDPGIGFFFTEIARIDLESHIPKIASFWEMQLFRTRSYKGNPYRAHKLLDMQVPMEPRHFQQWLQLFVATVDEHFHGERADTVKRNARAIASRMSHALSIDHPSTGLASAAAPRYTVTN
jgi:hemoglobin